MRSTRYIFTAIVLTVILFQGVCFAGREGNRVKSGSYAGYNVLFVSFDALQAAHTSCLGYFRKVTPTIDRFAEGGFLFKNAVAQSSWTVPSTMSYMTSLYPSQHKVVNKYSVYTEDEKVFANLKKLSPQAVTLAEVLKSNGYATGGFTGDTGVGAKFGFAQGFDTYFEGPVFGGMDRSIPEAINWVQNNSSRKFFIFLHGYDVHGQFDPPGGFTFKFVDPVYHGSLKGGKEEEAAIREEGLAKGSVSLTAEDVRFWRALYDEKISDVDKRFAVFIQKLEALGLLDKTIVVLFSDHGTEFYEHKRFDHGHTLYEELIHVPVVIWLPRAEGGMVISEQIRAIDIMPTILDLLGAKIPTKVKQQMQGVSLLPLINGQHMDLVAFSETDYRFYVCKRSVRTPDVLKFIYSMDTGQKELYNLKKDPQELVNLVNTDQKTAYELEQKLFSWMSSTGQDENYYKKLLKGVLKIKEY